MGIGEGKDYGSDGSKFLGSVGKETLCSLFTILS